VTGRAPLHLTVLVHPRASRTRVVGAHGDGIKVQVAAPPVDDAANRAVIDLLSAQLGVARRHLRIIAGAHGRRKIIAVDAPDTTTCRERLAALRNAVDKGNPRR
jgi:hypothetical protein